MTYDWMLVIFVAVPCIFSAAFVLACLLFGDRDPSSGEVGKPVRSSASTVLLVECWPGVDPFGGLLVEQVALTMRDARRGDARGTTDARGVTSDPTRLAPSIASVHDRGGPMNRDRSLRP